MATLDLRAVCRSVLVSCERKVLFENHNHLGGGDYTQHPEFAIARWAANNLDAHDRAKATVYTSGEHCPCPQLHMVGLVLAGSVMQARQLG